MIRFENVTKTYNENDPPVFSNLTFQVERGEMLAITGESGSGKTTLLSLILRENNVSSGHIWVAGEDITTLPQREIPFYRRRIGAVFQDFKLMQDLTAYENVKLALMMAGGREKDALNKITSVFTMLGIRDLHSKKPTQMSGGQQQKVCMARAIVNQPNVLLCDEPTGNLDPQSSEEIFKLLNLIHLRGITVLLASHDIDAIHRLGCNEMILGKDL